MVNLKNLVNTVTHKFNNSSTGKMLNGENWMKTTSGNNFIPEHTKTDGQKKFSTNSTIPNLPKPETMFFVYFNINAEAQNLIQKRKLLIEYLSNLNKTESKDTCLSYEQAKKEKKSQDLTNKIGEMMDNALQSLSEAFSKEKNKVKNDKKTENNTSSKLSSDYIPDKSILRQLSFELSKFVKSIDKPSIKYTIKEYNEYNRKRLSYQGRQYTPITINFYDVKENPVQQFFFSYLKMIDDTFLNKSSIQYKKNIRTTSFDDEYDDWGFNLDSNFRLIDSISIIEMYMDKIMVYTLENPVIESISFGKNNVGSYKANEIAVSFQYEGITNDLLVGKYGSPVEPYTNILDESNDTIYLKSMINSDIRADLATFIQKRYKDGASYAIDTASSFIKGILDAPKNERWDKFTSQILDTGRKIGFADEINFVTKVDDTIDKFKDSENKGKYIFKLTDDPSSIVGSVTGSNITTSDDSVLGLF